MKAVAAHHWLYRTDWLAGGRDERLGGMSQRLDGAAAWCVALGWRRRAVLAALISTCFSIAHTTSEQLLQVCACHEACPVLGSVPINRLSGNRIA